MKILILGASGDVGREVTTEAQNRGHQITASARNMQRLSSLDARIRTEALDVSTELEKLEQLMQDHDVVVSALRPIAGEEAKLVSMTNTVLVAARKTGKPVFITGGAGPLKIGDGTEHTVLTAPGFLPEQVHPIALASVAQNTLLDDFPDVNWVVLRPAAMLLKEDRTGRYAFGRDFLVKQADGQSRISYADFAVAIVDLIELQPAPRQRLTVGW